jgi:hypothetical protein
MALPIPRDEPVTMAVLPLRSKIVVIRLPPENVV